MPQRENDTIISKWNFRGTTNFSVRMDSDIKKQCETLYGELGMNLTAAVNVFLRQSLRVGGFPFEVRLNCYKAPV